MKLLIDNALSPLVAEGLRHAGYAMMWCMYVRDYGMQSSSEEEIKDAYTSEDIITNRELNSVPSFLPNN